MSTIRDISSASGRYIIYPLNSSYFQIQLYHVEKENRQSHIMWDIRDYHRLYQYQYQKRGSQQRPLEDDDSHLMICKDYVSRYLDAQWVALSLWYMLCFSHSYVLLEYHYISDRSLHRRHIMIHTQWIGAAWTGSLVSASWIFGVKHLNFFE